MHLKEKNNFPFTVVLIAEEDQVLGYTLDPRRTLQTLHCKSQNDQKQLFMQYQLLVCLRKLASKS